MNVCIRSLLDSNFPFRKILIHFEKIQKQVSGFLTLLFEEHILTLVRIWNSFWKAVMLIFKTFKLKDFKVKNSFSYRFPQLELENSFSVSLFRTFELKNAIVPYRVVITPSDHFKPLKREGHTGSTKFFVHLKKIYFHTLHVREWHFSIYYFITTNQTS